MPKPRLSPAQQAVVDAMLGGWELEERVRWRWRGAKKSPSRVVCVNLLRLGVIKRSLCSPYISALTRCFELTPEWRAE